MSFLEREKKMSKNEDSLIANKQDNYQNDNQFLENLDTDPKAKKAFCYPDEISFDDVTIINKTCLLDKEPYQILDQGRIESALGNQYQPYERRELAFASVYKSLVINHGFLNGNKRTAVIALYLASIMLNNPLNISDEDLAKLTYQIASENGSRISVEDIAKQVFSYYATVGEIKRIPHDDVETLSKSFINNHKWLIEELAK